MAMEMGTNLTTLRIDSADELERKIAPAGYYPQQLTGPVVYDDEVADLSPDMPWREYFAGGSNRPHWIRTARMATRTLWNAPAGAAATKCTAPITASITPTPTTPSGAPKWKPNCYTDR